jgi:hypothetical protein
VPAGRVEWSAAPCHRTVYTLQNAAVLDEITATGSYIMRDRSHSFTPDFAAAYAWMRDQMRQRIGAPTTDFWPIWGWPGTSHSTLVDACRDPADGVLLRLEVPAYVLLESNFDAWHAALNNIPLYPPEIELDTPEWDAWERESNRLITAENLPAIEETWATMFDLPAWNRTAHTQAVMHEIRDSWITGAVHIKP